MRTVALICGAIGIILLFAFSWELVIGVALLIFAKDILEDPETYL